MDATRAESWSSCCCSYESCKTCSPARPRSLVPRNSDMDDLVAGTEGKIVNSVGHSQPNGFIRIEAVVFGRKASGYLLLGPSEADERASNNSSVRCDLAYQWPL